MGYNTGSKQPCAFWSAAAPPPPNTQAPTFGKRAKLPESLLNGHLLLPSPTSQNDPLTSLSSSIYPQGLSFHTSQQSSTKIELKGRKHGGKDDSESFSLAAWFFHWSGLFPFDIWEYGLQFLSTDVQSAETPTHGCTCGVTYCWLQPSDTRMMLTSFPTWPCHPVLHQRTGFNSDKLTPSHPRRKAPNTHS